MRKIAVVLAGLLVPSFGQTPGTKPEFEVASIRVNPPRTGFHFAPDADAGKADLSNPGLFRCSNCTLTTLLRAAFDLQNYQIPGRSALGDDTFEVKAKIPAGATREDVPAMIQALLKDRFGLAYHFKDKTMRGYHLVIAKNGSKLKESAEDAQEQKREPAPHASGQSWGQGHTHNGLMVFNGSATYRGDHQTTGELASLLSDQLGVPVSDETGLPGRYAISLKWAGNVSQSGSSHSDGGWGGVAGHGDHGGGSGGQASPGRSEESGPTLFEALQSQLGLKLVPSEQTVARIFIVDHVERIPTAN